MNRNLLRKLGMFAGVSLLLMGQIVRAEEPQNLLKNAGFEEIVPYTVPEKWQGKIEATEMPKGWGINIAYPGKLTVIYDAITSHGGSKYIKLETERAGKQGGEHFVGGGVRPPVNPDKKYLIKVWAKGKGAINLGVYGYSVARPRGGKFIPGFGSGWMQVNSPEEWKEYRFEFSTKSKPKIKSVAVYFSITGTIYLDDAYFAPLPD